MMIAGIAMLDTIIFAVFSVCWDIFAAASLTFFNFMLTIFLQGSNINCFFYLENSIPLQIHIDLFIICHFYH